MRCGAWGMCAVHSFDAIDLGESGRRHPYITHEHTRATKPRFSHTRTHQHTLRFWLRADMTFDSRRSHRNRTLSPLLWAHARTCSEHAQPIAHSHYPRTQTRDNMAALRSCVLLTSLLHCIRTTTRSPPHIHFSTSRLSQRSHALQVGRLCS